MGIAENLIIVKDEIEKAANRSSRSSEDVILVAVTKNVSPEIIQAAIDLGVTHVGENKVQEITRKYDILGTQVTWHMIGHLQRNKVKYIIDKVDYIHSVDSLSLAMEIDKRAGAINRKMKCLLEVNISGEESKYGLSPNEVLPLLKELEGLNNIEIVGLMTMAPYVDESEEAREYFKGLKELAQSISEVELKNCEMKYLSMGMSNDFVVAVEEGANIVRVGSAIFNR